MHTLYTPKHLLYPVTTSQCPTVLLRTRPRSQTKTRMHTLTQPILHAHHWQPTTTLELLQQPRMITIYG